MCKQMLCFLGDTEKPQVQPVAEEIKTASTAHFASPLVINDEPALLVVEACLFENSGTAQDLKLSYVIYVS